MRMKKNVEYLETVLHRFDEDGDGKISPSELRNRLSLVMGCDQLLLEEAVEAVESLDSDGDGLLGLDDLSRLMDLNESDDIQEEEKVKDLRLAFGMYIDDVEIKDFITPQSLKRMLSRLGESKSVEECKVMIDHFDLNGDGVICFEEFRIMMMQ